MTREARVRISPLGGVGEVGKNSTLVELAEEMLIVDAGVKFPETELHGVDLVVCDYSYIADRLDSLVGIVFTHGHEDHIGGLPYLIMQLDPHDPIPIYGTPLTLGLISVKLKEHGLLGRVIQYAIRDGQRSRLGPFEIEPIAVNHSIPDAVGLVIRTPAGVLFHTGDFKFDPTPVEGRTTDNERLRQLGDEGVLALLSDCVRVEQPGWTASELGVREALEQLIGLAPGRVLVTTFASNIGRLREVVRSAHKLGRKTSIVGRSMEENLRVARDLGFMNVPEGSLVDLRDLNDLPPEKVVLLSTGSQGEPTSVLSRIARGDHPLVKIQPNDTVIFSASPVPGNEESVARSIDNLFRRGARVIYQMIDPRVHVSGHASREELKHLLDLVRPKYLVPLHGEHRMLWLFRELAAECGIPRENVFLTEIGDVVAFGEAGAQREEPISSGSVLVDGLTIGEVTNVVLRDRRRLAADGVVFVSVTLDRETGELLSGPDFVSRGFLQLSSEETDGLFEEARERVCEALEGDERRQPDVNYLVGKVRDTLNSFVYERTRRRPMILPRITEV
ncbi:MAG: ribonuclease J [Chloroflexi bacterium]|nr:MAG: ribonuclease J [Chloroflexota bacterium]